MCKNNIKICNEKISLVYKYNTLEEIKINTIFF